MVYCYRKVSNVQSNIINLSQLDYKKSTCPANLEHTCNLCQELHTLEKDVEKAIAGLKQLLNRHQNLKTEINRTHSPIIRDLPVEILFKIFYSCFSEEMRKVDGEPKDGDYLVPLKVGAEAFSIRLLRLPSIRDHERVDFQIRSASCLCDTP
ncbi:hypothetical protein CPC08DRAFT_771139 [Agrocybe pediades]|nr:hypothetical protein CPC08DRAFT_771139 [Agrocybe pediades]